jgi:predicted TIM-barrel fold metal-dependent hydrolase
MDTDTHISRRDVLRVGAAAIGAGVLASGCAAPAQRHEPMGPYIDCHSHIWTPDTDRYPLMPGKTKADLDPPSFTAEELLATARPHGVGRVVLIAHMGYYRFDNRYLIDSAAKHPGVFSIVAGVDDKAPRPQDAMRHLAKRGARGFRISSWDDPEHWLDGPGMAAMWTCGAEDDLAMCPLIDAAILPAVAKMCQRFPDTPVVIDHFARIGVDGTIRDADVDQLCRLASFKHVHVKVSAFYALGAKKPPYEDLLPMIRRLLGAYGAQRLMWGSDSPYQLAGEHTYGASIALVRDRLGGVSDEERSWLLRGTAERVFFR